MAGMTTFPDLFPSLVLLVTACYIGPYHNSTSLWNHAMKPSRDHSGYGLSQWETMLQCTVVSHWLSPYSEWSLDITTLFVSSLSIFASDKPVTWGQPWERCFNTSSLRQNGRHPDDIFKCIFLNKNVWISIRISLKFVPKVPIDNKASLVQIMAWHWIGNKPLFEPWPIQIWQAYQQQCCWDVCQISMWYKNFISQSCGFKTSQFDVVNQMSSGILALAPITWGHLLPANIEIVPIACYSAEIFHPFTIYLIRGPLHKYLLTLCENHFRFTYKTLFEVINDQTNLLGRGVWILSIYRSYITYWILYYDIKKTKIMNHKYLIFIMGISERQFKCYVEKRVQEFYKGIQSI